MLGTFFTGFGLSFSLIMAIGAQNAFVLKMGLRRAHVLPLVLTCALSDAVLISVGVWGFAGVADVLPGLAPVMRWLGASFLIVYGALSFRAALRGGAALDPTADRGLSLGAAVLTCLAFTWLNPHVYLDTVVLLGSIAQGFPGQERAFGAGAIAASFAFFFMLGYGARLLAPLFARPMAWRVLDVVIGCVMWSIAAGLILKG
ncbi:amino acid transporter [Loktanella sp. IMCC34160]|uniref:LysE/ArgO family amino acid transporter n=1 Tax=Loktanella sp. IMCC34160 TaxID=2510646 RepID=UPI00101D1A70|nr:LysE/ArgO family amino acid transporter [Loktanella sp. IMCC34160]RYG90697.1 amino acid transporter [Loktanella sp. IMCC34160]